MLRILTRLALVILISSNLYSADKIHLWSEGAPGSQERMNEPEKGSRKFAKNIHHPSITAFLPDPDIATGTALIIAPGGGHKVLVVGYEGDALAEWLAEHGIAAFVLRYRLSNEPDSPYDLHEHSLADMRRAIRLVRHRAEEWTINPDRIGVGGFSAGGELAAYASMDFDTGEPKADDPIERQSSRPDFQVLVYPGKSSTFSAEEGMPPCFIAAGYDDRDDISMGMAELYLKYKQAGVPCELHLYANVGHGFGLNSKYKAIAAYKWPQRMLEWLVDSKLLNADTKEN